MGRLVRLLTLFACTTLFVCACASFRGTSGYARIDKADTAAISRKLLEDPAWINSKNELGLGPLSYAAKSGKADVCKLLLDKGAQVDEVDSFKRTPLHFAAAGGHEAVVQLLLAHGADCKHSDIEGHTPLHAAVTSGNLEVVKQLIKAGADVNARDMKGESVFDFAMNRVKDCQAKLHTRSESYSTQNTDDLDRTLREVQAIARRLRRQGAKTTAELER